MNLEEMFNKNTFPELKKPRLPLFFYNGMIVGILFYWAFNANTLFELVGLNNTPMFVKVIYSTVSIICSLNPLLKILKGLALFCEVDAFTKRLTQANVFLDKKVFVVNNQKVELNDENIERYLFWGKLPTDKFNELLYVLKSSLLVFATLLFVPLMICIYFSMFLRWWI